MSTAILATILFDNVNFVIKWPVVIDAYWPWTCLKSFWRLKNWVEASPQWDRIFPVIRCFKISPLIRPLYIARLKNVAKNKVFQKKKGITISVRVVRWHHIFMQIIISNSFSFLWIFSGKTNDLSIKKLGFVSFILISVVLLCTIGII